MPPTRLLRDRLISIVQGQQGRHQQVTIVALQVTVTTPRTAGGTRLERAFGRSRRKVRDCLSKCVWRFSRQLYWQQGGGHNVATVGVTMHACLSKMRDEHDPKWTRVYGRGATGRATVKTTLEGAPSLRSPPKAAHWSSPALVRT